MNNDELNKWLHENVMGDCWHPNPPRWRYGPDKAWTCKGQCGQRIYHRDIRKLPNYTNDLNAVRRVEEKVIEKVGQTGYMAQLVTIAYVDVDYTAFRLEMALAMATAEQRAKACKAAWEQL